VSAGQELAFPYAEKNSNGSIYNDHYGMTKREFFAAEAMKGIVANPCFFGPTFQQSPESAAQFAVQCADFLLIELTKG